MFKPLNVGVRSVAILLAIYALPAAADSNPEGRWSIKPYFGISQMGDISVDFTNIDGLSGDVDVDIDSGFTAGLAAAYRYNSKYSAEIGWEYRSNDSETTLADTSVFDDGNYASNIFYVNGYYHFTPNGKWEPYVGAGLVLVQEVDIDLERAGEEISLTSDGEVGFQFFGGANYRWSDNWSINGEVRFGSVTGIDLGGESGTTGDIEDIDYETLTFQLGLSYQF